MNKVKAFLAAALMSSLFLSGCNHNFESSTDSSDDGKEQVYVLPTDFGKRYLKGSSGIKKAIELKGQDEDGSYHMAIDASAVEGSAVKFNAHGTDYTSDDIDVMLFGIGTNFNNTSTAETLLYATMEEPVDLDTSGKGEVTDGSTDSSVETTESSETTTESSTEEPTPAPTIVTGVEYAYGTGPIKNEFDKEQLLWLKTTVMEEKNGVFVASPTADIKFTPVYIELKDTVAPAVSDFAYSITYSDYANTYRNDLENSLKQLIKENATYINGGEIDKDVQPEISYFAITGGAKEVYYAGETITGEFSFIDGDGNESEKKSFIFHLDKDYAVDKLIDMPYSTTVLLGKTETEAYLKAAVANAMYPDTHSLDEAKVSFEGFDSLFTELSNLKENITTGKEFALNATITGYAYNETSATFPFKVKLYDDKPMTWTDNVVWSTKQYLPNYKQPYEFKTYSDYIKAISTGIVSINDDFEDEYFWCLESGIIIDSTDPDNGYDDRIIWGRLYLLDSSLRKKLSEMEFIPTANMSPRGDFSISASSQGYASDAGLVHEVESFSSKIGETTRMLYKFDGTLVAI